MELREPGWEGTQAGTGEDPCRIYSVKKNGPRMRQTAAMTDSIDKLACDLSVEIKVGDELPCGAWRHAGDSGGSRTLFCQTGLIPIMIRLAACSLVWSTREVGPVDGGDNKLR